MEPDYTVLPTGLPKTGPQKPGEGSGSNQGSPKAIVDQEQCCRVASGTLWRPDAGETYALFEEGKPAQNNCRASRQLKSLVSPEVPRRDEAQQRALLASAGVFLAVAVIIIVFGEER